MAVVYEFVLRKVFQKSNEQTQTQGRIYLTTNNVCSPGRKIWKGSKMQNYLVIFKHFVLQRLLYHL